MKVLNHGEIELIDHMGSDLRICEAARVSTGSKADKGPEKNKKLIEYLYMNNHVSPFEKVVLEFYVKCPIFVARQWFRHRTMSFNEKSARYSEFKWETYIPYDWRKQDNKNKQGSSEIVNPEFNSNWLNTLLEDSYQKSCDAYNELLLFGVAREQARTIMPVGQYTEFFMTVNLRNLFHFLELRLHPHAQYEIRVYAEAILKILKSLPNLEFSVNIFDKKRKFDYTISEKIKDFSLEKVQAYLEKMEE